MKMAMSVTPTKFGGTACLRFASACLRFCLRTYVVVLWCGGARTCFSHPISYHMGVAQVWRESGADIVVARGRGYVHTL